MDNSAAVDVSMLPLRGEALVEALDTPTTAPRAPEHEPSWWLVLLALGFVVWAFNWRRNKPGLIRTILRQLRR